jgi:hypothetical protein
MSPSSSQLLSSGYGNDMMYGNPYHRSRTSGMMYNPSYYPNFQPERGMMPNYPMDYPMYQQHQYEMMRRGREEDQSGNFQRTTNENMNYNPQTQDPKKFYEYDNQGQMHQHYQQNLNQQPTNTNGLPQNTNSTSPQQQNVNQTPNTQSLPNLTSQPSFGPSNQSNQTVSTTQQSFNPNTGNYPFFNNPQMMNAQINKTSMSNRSQNPVESFYQIPLVSSMVKESSKESQQTTQSSQSTTSSNQGNTPPQQ